VRVGGQKKKQRWGQKGEKKPGLRALAGPGGLHQPKKADRQKKSRLPGYQYLPRGRRRGGGGGGGGPNKKGQRIPKNPGRGRGGAQKHDPPPKPSGGPRSGGGGGKKRAFSKEKTTPTNRKNAGPHMVCASGTSLGAGLASRRGAGSGAGGEKRGGGKKPRGPGGPGTEFSKFGKGTTMAKFFRGNRAICAKIPRALGAPGRK